jgi:hypothetical protein
MVRKRVVGLGLAGVACILCLMLGNNLEKFKRGDQSRQIVLYDARSPAARLAGWDSSSYQARPETEPHQQESSGPARLAGWSPPLRKTRRAKMFQGGLKKSMLASVDHFRTSDDAAPKWADRSWHRFSDYKLKSAMKRLEFSERMSETNLHSIHNVAQPVQVNQFYRTNFES